MVKLQQYYIFKINTNYLKSKKYNINLSLKDARKSGMVVSLGDSQMLRSLRLLKHQNIIQEEINFLLKEKQKIKKKKSSQENCNKLLEIEQKIDENLFVPEIVSVLVDDIRHYTTIGQNGFILNNKKYKRLLCGAGQARRNNALFIQEDYEIPLKKLLNNNHNPEIEITPAKYSAYFALASSASIPVSEPYFCVVPDYEIIRTERVDYIEEIEDGDDLVINHNYKDMDARIKENKLYERDITGRETEDLDFNFTGEGFKLYEKENIQIPEHLSKIDESELEDLKF